VDSLDSFDGGGGFAAGDGADTIRETGSGTRGDSLVFSGDISADTLWLAQHGNDLVLRVIGSDDSVTIADWYLDEGHRVERIEGGDGRVLTAAGVDQLVAAMAVFDVAPGSGPTLPPGSLPPLAPVIAAAWQPTTG